MKVIGYHGTNSFFDHFDLNYCGSIKNNASNSKLGLFFGSGVGDDHEECPDYVKSFGEYVIKVEFDSADIHILEFKKIFLMHKESESEKVIDDDVYWLEKRQEFLDKGFKVLALEEKSMVDGRKDKISMYIVLDTDVILNHEYIKSPGLKFS